MYAADSKRARWTGGKSFRCWLFAFLVLVAQLASPFRHYHAEGVDHLGWHSVSVGEVVAGQTCSDIDDDHALNESQATFDGGAALSSLQQREIAFAPASGVQHHACLAAAFRLFADAVPHPPPGSFDTSLVAASSLPSSLPPAPRGPPLHV